MEQQIKSIFFSFLLCTYTYIISYTVYNSCYELNLSVNKLMELILPPYINQIIQ